MSDTPGHNYRPGVFYRIDPVDKGVSLVFDIPRSGREYPPTFRSPAGFDEVKTSISMYVEQLFDQAPAHGATWLYACFPNAYIDANRNETDIDPALIDGSLDTPFAPTDKSGFGVGLIHSVCDGNRAPLQHAPLTTADLQRRLNEYYWPYHNELSSILKTARERHGVAYHVSCHSMASVARAVSSDAGKTRSDFDIGDRHGTTCDRGFVDAAHGFLRDLGYDATVNEHFAGAECIARHGDPANGVHSLQIETRRGLYMDEVTYEKTPGFETVRTHLGQLAAHLAKYANA